MRAHPLHRVVAPSHFGDNGIVIVGVKPSAIADLPAGFGVEGRVIKNDLTGVPGFEFLRALTALDDSQHFAIVGARLAIAFEVGFRELLVGKIGGLLGCAFPGGTSALALLSHGALEASLVKLNALIARRILHEVEWHTKGVIQLERNFAGEHRLNSHILKISNTGCDSGTAVSIG